MTAAVPLTLDVGGWSLRVGRAPWHLSLEPHDGGAGLVEAPRRAGAIGPLGFQTPAGTARRRWRRGPTRQEAGPANEDEPPLADWWQGDRVLEESTGSGIYRATVSTTHPEGWLLEVVVSPGDHRSVAVEARVRSGGDVEAIGQGFVAHPGERWLGFGERSDAVERTGGVIEAYVGEGPYQEHEYPFLEELIPGWALRRRRDATYYPVPWALSTRGVGLLVDNDEISYTRLRPGGMARWSVEVEADRLAYRVFPGPRPLDALARYSASTGRQRVDTPPWWFGPWVQTGHANHVPLATEAGHISRLQESAAPVSAVETHCRYLPLGEHRGHEGAERARADHFHAAGLATLSYLNPFVGVEFTDAFESAAAAGALQRKPDGSPYVFTAYAGGRTPPETREAQYDFTTPAGAAAWGAVAAELVAAGHDGWMEDFGEYTPFDARSGDGTPGESAHNRYPTDYHRAAAGVAQELETRHRRRLARFVRSGWTGTAPWAPIVWGGDPTTSWGFDGLASAVREALSIGASGVAVWGSDTGGFFSSVDRLDAELLTRWIQFSAFCPVMRTKSSGIEVFPYDRPQVWDAGILPVWRRWATLHTQLLPYLRAALREYAATGMPVMRACGLVWPDLDAFAGVDDQYLFGPDLLVAPVLGPGVRSRPVVLPPGRWIELWSALRYDPSTRGVTPIDRCVAHDGGDGGATVVVPAPGDEIPVLVRAGARLELLDPSVVSLAGCDEDPPAAVRLDF